MQIQGTLLAACAMLTLAACAHDQPRQRASVSAVTNREVAANEAPEKTRMHYTEVSDQHALGRDQNVYTTVQPGNAVPHAKVQVAPSCGLEVHFPTDSATLDEPSQNRLDGVAECIKRHEIDHATIVGSADPRGSKEHNEKLSLERARVVAEYLRGRGVPERDIHVRGKGEIAQADRELWPYERGAQVQVTP